MLALTVTLPLPVIALATLGVVIMVGSAIMRRSLKKTAKIVLTISLFSSIFVFGVYTRSWFAKRLEARRITQFIEQNEQDAAWNAMLPQPWRDLWTKAYDARHQRSGPTEAIEFALKIMDKTKVPPLPMDGYKQFTKITDRHFEGLDMLIPFIERSH